MVDDERICQCCGQRIRKLNPHRMDFGKVRVLRWIAEINRKFEWAKVQQDMHLIPAEEREWTIQTDAVHASRLVWFGLLDRRGDRDGLFRINRNGIEFLRGNHLVPRVIYCREGEVVERDEVLVSISQVKGVILDKAYWDDYWMIQKSPRKPHTPDMFSSP